VQKEKKNIDSNVTSVFSFVGYRLLLPHTDKLAGFHLHYFFIRAVE
jgi:hypothetical protein